MSRVTDEYGRCTIPLDEAHNTPGKLIVDGDVYESGPVAFLEFDLSSEDIGSEGEISFGPFSVTISGCNGARVTGNVVLNESDARLLIAALAEQFIPAVGNGQEAES